MWLIPKTLCKSVFLAGITLGYSQKAKQEKKRHAPAMKTSFSFAMADASEKANLYKRWSKDIQNVKFSPSVTMPRKMLEQKC